ncbi:hypothetical protein D8Y22_06910 [Salinadaptatus halalkaliphilus]|uniref:Uncharacterized protein n=1 Tax=Salinadaptatus halalkaliphilus TaxID=2419781 RepID=A0A4S3TPD0_9EURY|nr:hypothetical protein [Salinadaptatus halalkaliphilus]THE65540.1 hypothetical protein D8Y22_06910 [Salinadaptatus halalkaliphilus]
MKDRTESNTGTTRRRFLAAGAGAALAGMAGCLGQVAGRMTDTSASPAAMIPATLTGGGVEQLQSGFRSPGSRVFDVTDLRAQSVPASIKSSGVLSASLELDGWSVDTIQPANDYNSVRSNKRRSAVGIVPDEINGDDPDEDDDGFDELREALYAYLEIESVAGESVAVSLPDADIPRGPAIADEITPERIFQYMTSDQLCVEREGRVYCWGNNSFKSVRDGDIDVMAWSWGANRAELLVPERSDRSIVARTRGSSVVVTVQNDPPEAGRESGSGMVSNGGFTPDYEWEDSTASDGWGEESESGGVTATPVIVAPALALPEGAPMPIPAVAYVRRCKHEGEYIYTGGWVIDDGALYEDSCTLLTLQGPNEVVSFTPEDVASTDGQQALLQRIRRDTRHRRRGASLHRGNIDEDLLGALPEEFHSDQGRRELFSLVEETLQQKNRGRNPQTGKEIMIPLRDGPASDDHDVMSGVTVALDCPLVHLVDADDDQKAEATDMYLKIVMVGEEDTRRE